jgi:hypothetical protein
VLLLLLRAASAAAEMLLTAAQVAAGVSFSYNAPEFLILRIGLLDGYSIDAHDLVLLEAGVQKVITSSRTAEGAVTQMLMIAISLKWPA